MSNFIIKQLIIYPIKSLGPVFKDESFVGPTGLSGDREMMLVDSHGKFITQRTKTELVRFQVKSFQDTYKVIDRWGSEECIIQASDFTQKMDDVEIWDDHVTQVWMNPLLSEWFSNILQEDVRLVKLNPKHPRQMAEKHQTSFASSTSFADSLPILLCTTASLNFVEEDYGSFDFLRFRPNIIIKNEVAFEEDHWKEMQIGAIHLIAKKRCARCNLIMVDPRTGEIDKTFLAKLSAYRTFEHKVFFGVQFVPASGGLLTVGDPVLIQS